jgi:hypothetical protein
MVRPGQRPIELVNRCAAPLAISSRRTVGGCGRRTPPAKRRHRGFGTVPPVTNPAGGARRSERGWPPLHRASGMHSGGLAQVRAGAGVPRCHRDRSMQISLRPQAPASTARLQPNRAPGPLEQRIRTVRETAGASERLPAFADFQCSHCCVDSTENNSSGSPPLVLRCSSRLDAR